MKLLDLKYSVHFALQSLLLVEAQAMTLPRIHDTRNNGLVKLDVACAENFTRMPDGAWDSHLHILDPTRYPSTSDAAYTTGIYTVWDNSRFEETINGDHITMIQPSIYGNDNTGLLEALSAYGPDRARGVVVFDAGNITVTELKKWNALGVRGVRVNLQSNDKDLPVEELSKTLKKYADLIRPLGWVLQLYVPMTTIARIEDIVSTLDVQVVFDHFGSPTMPEPSNDPQTLDPYTLDGFGALVRLLKQGNTWVKISGAYRLSKLDGPEWTDLDPVAKELFSVAQRKLVFATDWPHTRFEGLDIRPWVEHLLDLTQGDETLRQRLFRDNARDLWGVERTCK